MPQEEEAVVPSPEVDESWINLAEIREARDKEKEAPAAPEPKAEEAKTAPVTEAGKVEEEQEEAGKDDKPKGGFQRRIDKLTKEKSELERTVGDLQARLEALETKKPEVKAEASGDGDPEPKEEDFKDYKEYAKSLARWVTRQELKADKEAAKKADEERSRKDTETRAKEQFDKYRDGLTALRQKDPALEAALSDDLRIPDYIHHQLIRMPNGPEVAAALIKNKAVWQKIAELNDEALKRGDGDFSEAFWEFGTFVRSLKNSSPKPVERPVSQAPAPITPSRGGTAPAEIDIDNLSTSEYRRMRESGKIR